MWKCQCGNANPENKKCLFCGAPYCAESEQKSGHPNKKTGRDKNGISKLKFPFKAAIYAALWSWPLIIIGTLALSDPNMHSSIFGNFTWFIVLAIITTPLIGFCAGATMEEKLIAGRDSCVGIGIIAGAAVGFMTGTAIYPVLLMGDIGASLIFGTGPGIIVGSIIGGFCGDLLSRRYWGDQCKHLGKTRD
ncbi:MAG: hypothetical protein PHW04_06580 [Candidatus Wallbacteria bacterium]|nr:hypothetical protein [Candidatus Wallbacteria bacterium]